MTTYVLVHGGFIDGWYWGETAALLEEEGHRVVVADLPSTGRDAAALGGLADDAAAVRGLVDAAGEAVVLVGHSYGGMVITELGDHPGVAHAVYLAAFWPARGQSVLDLFGDLPPDGWIVPTEDGSAAHVTDDRELARATLADDVGAERFADFHAHMMLSSTAALGEPCKAPERAHPVTYIVLERDYALPTAAQEQMAVRADRVERMPASHGVMLSDPGGLAAILSRIS